MPSPIGTVNQLVSVIRAQLASRPEIIPATLQQPVKTTAQAKTGNAKSLHTLIGQRIKSIDANDPQRGRKAFRIFLESILLSHFGENLINDPKFYQMVDDIHLAMESDSEVREQIDAAVSHLVSNSVKS